MGTPTRTTAPLTKAQREALRKFVEERGEVEAVSVLGMTKVTLAKALSGMNVSRSTVALVVRCGK